MTGQERVGLAWIFLSASGYAFLPILTKLVYAADAGISPITLGILRYILAVPITWAGVLLWERRTGERGASPVGQLLFTGLFMGGATLAVFYGLDLLDASTYVVIFFTYPAMVAVASALMGKPLSRRGWLALAMTSTGIVLTVPELFTGNITNPNMTLGVWVGLGNAALVAAFLLISARTGRDGSPRSAAWTMTGALLAVLPGLAVPGFTLTTSPLAWTWILGLVLFGTVVALFGLIMGASRIGAARTSIIGTVEPAMTIALAFLVLGERMQPVQWVGAALILTSVVILEARGLKRNKREPVVVPSGD